MRSTKKSRFESYWIGVLIVAGSVLGCAPIQSASASMPLEPEELLPSSCAFASPNTGLREAPGDAGCAAGMVRIQSFCIDRFEAELVDVHGGTEVAWSPYQNPAERHVRAVSIAGAVPQGYISAVQAQAACVASGKRLCTDAEWLRACQGAAGTEFPYGDRRYPDGSSPLDPPCNEARARHPVVELFGHGPDAFKHLNDACINQLPASVAPAGAFSRCVSADGVYDLMGNLHEWTADPAGTFRGGFYVDTRVNGSGCHYVTVAHSPVYWDYSTGFRCCADSRLGY